MLEGHNPTYLDYMIVLFNHSEDLHIICFCCNQESEFHWLLNMILIFWILRVEQNSISESKVKNVIKHCKWSLTSWDNIMKQSFFHCLFGSSISLNFKWSWFSFFYDFVFLYLIIKSEKYGQKHGVIKKKHTQKKKDY